MTRFLRNTGLALITTLIATGLSFAQVNNINSVNTGMGGGGTAFTSGHHAIFLNPANMMVNNRDTRLSFGLMGFGTGIGGPLVNIGVYNDYFTTGRLLDTATSLELSNVWFGEEIDARSSLGFYMDITPIAASYRANKSAFGFAARTRVFNRFEINKGMLQLGLTGFSSDTFSDFVPVGSSLEIMATTELAFSYARQVWQSNRFLIDGTHTVYAGVSPVLVLGQGYLGFEMDSDLRIREAEGDLTHRFDISMRTVGELSNSMQAFVDARNAAENPSDVDISDYLDDGFSDAGSVLGTAFKFNIGATYEWDRGEIARTPILGSGKNIIRMSVSLQDMGSITFDNTKRFSSNGTLDWNGIDLDQDRIDRDFDGERGDYIDYVLTDSLASDIYFNFQSEDASSFSMQSTPTFTVGFAYIYGRASAVLDFGKGYSDHGFHNDRAFMTLGGEYRIIDIIPIRFGMRTGGYTETLYSFGTGLSLKNFEFSVGAMTRSESGDRGTALAFAWSGIQLRF